MSVLDIDAVRAVTRLIDKGFEAYLVGGCVRDLLLGRTPKDYDIATEARPPQVKRTFPRNCRIIGRRFKLAHLHFHGNTKILECSTFRRTPQERPEGEGDDADLLITRDNEFGTAEEDALRRDFTINALFLDPTRDLIVDHVNGLEDIEARVIRTIGDPVVRFREDPVRILRAAKFAGRLGFTIEKKTLAAMAETAEDLKRAAPPRVLEEILRLLRSGHAHSSFKLLQDIGAIEHLIPVVGTFLVEASKEQLDTFWDLLEALDSRMQSQPDGSEPPPNGVLLAVMMYGAVASGRERNPTRSPSSIAESLLGSLAIDLRLPRRDAGCLKRICGVQHRFEQPEGKRRFGVEAFLHSPYFEEALQLYALRTLAAGGERTNIDHWYDLSDNHAIEAQPEQAEPAHKQPAHKQPAHKPKKNPADRSGGKRDSDKAANDRSAEVSEDSAAGDPATGDSATGDPATGDPATGDPATGDPATGPRKKRRRRTRRRADDKEEASNMKVDDASAESSSSEPPANEMDQADEQAEGNNPSVDSDLESEVHEPEAVEPKAAARKRKPRKRTPRVKRSVEDEEDLSDVTFPSFEPAKPQEEPVDEPSEPMRAKKKRGSRRQTNSEQETSQQDRRDQHRSAQRRAEDDHDHRDAEHEEERPREYSDQETTPERDSRESDRSESDRSEPQRTRSRRPRRSRSRSKADREGADTHAEYGDREYGDRESDAREHDPVDDDHEPRVDVRESEDQDADHKPAAKRRRGQRGRRRGRKDPHSAEGDRAETDSRERVDEGHDDEHKSEARKAPAKSRGKKAANGRDKEQRSRNPKHRNSPKDSKRGSRRDSKRGQAPRSTGGRDVDVVPRYRDRRGKVEVIEPASLDLSAFDVELDPKRVPTFGSIVEGKGRPKRRGPRIMDEQNDSYRPPPPPSDGSSSPNSPPPAPPTDGPDTFGDW